MRLTAILCGLLAMLCSTIPAAAQQAADGYFIAKRACPATPAIRRGGNPGDVMLEVDRAYRLVARNAEGGSHYLVVVPRASPERRWVDVSCGQRVASVGDVPVVGEGGAATALDRQPTPSSSQTASTRPPAASGGAILAISWQPAFCETRPNKDECESQTTARPDAKAFSLHGLWPQPRGREYCGVEERVRALDTGATWSRLPEPQLTPATRAALAVAMPGTQSSLDRHEWIRHGTCYGDAETYFSHSIMLLNAVNASAVGQVFASRIGKAVTADEIRVAFDAGFGRGAGERVRIACEKDGDREIIGELTIGLSGAIGPGADIGTLIRAARPTSVGCPEGIVDAAGLQ